MRAPRWSRPRSTLPPAPARNARASASPAFTYVVGDIYNLPFDDDFFDTVVTVRVLHHITDIPAALAEVARVLVGRGVYVLEYANKRNLKAMVRYALGRQPSPYTPEPWEFVKLNFNFHPAYMARELADAGFAILDQRAASFFRVGLLKRVVPTGLLAGLDRRAAGAPGRPEAVAQRLSAGRGAKGQRCRPGHAVALPALPRAAGRRRQPAPDPGLRLLRGRLERRRRHL